ncbi:MAG: type III-A CRISPR-associated protein Cas10/Csm1 [Anaerolineae bacterium]|nr:type III-A CRISPR-associated protein Cas10/Csm1 [Anaerolineae bacterium]
MKTEVFNAALAGLLHNIGTFAQRAGEDIVISEIVPALWVNAVQTLTTLEAHGELIDLARRLAAGGLPDEGQVSARQLQSIFCSITGLRDKNDQPLNSPKTQYVPLKKLAIASDTIFPIDAMADPTGDYQALWRAFKAETAQLKVDTEQSGADLDAYLLGLLDLMQQYTWCVPADVDVSLYDHSRMTAALAACLADLPTLPKADSNAPVALLVGGDISGVQKFIYSITSKGATAGLRGRSMYLQLLTEIIARYLLDALEAPPTNVIYAGGGHLYLIVPLSAKTDLPALQQRISRILLHHHQGDLYLALASQAITADEFRGALFHAGWDSLQKKLQAVKQRKFVELGTQLADLLFTPMDDGGNEEKQCVVCQREHPDTNTEPDDPSHKDGTRKCPVCRGFEHLGKQLRDASYLCLDQIEPKAEPEPTASRADWYDILQQFGYQVRVAKTLGQINGIDKRLVKRRFLLALNDEARQGLRGGIGPTMGRRFLVNVTPKLTAQEVAQYEGTVEDGVQLQEGNVKPFEVMVQQSKGIKRLGVLRMDIDNLGQIFSQGLPKNSFTIARMATLSFGLSLFFEGWVAPMAQQVDRLYPFTAKDRDTGEDQLFHQRLYAIYSGGDDLFFVGAWDVMPALAERINSDLQTYTGYHPGFHISGGIALVSAKYPLYQAAEDAAEAESAAKAVRPNWASGQPEEMAAKNALAFLGEVIPWEKFDEVKGWQTKLVDLVEPHDNRRAAPRSLLQRLRELYIVFDKQREAYKKAGVTMKLYWGPGQWRSAYSLNRLAKQYKNDDHIKAALLEIHDSLSIEQFTNIQWLGLAARWAALLTRKGE